MEVDPRFSEHFRNLKQVFLYITDRCNLECAQCIYKPSITFQMAAPEIPPDIALSLLHEFRQLGASKLSILGGEPTLYGVQMRNRPLFDLISGAKGMGFSYLRIVTNGQWQPSLLDNEGLRSLDEITFSLDGFSPETNDILRGPNTFKRSVDNIRNAVALGYRVHVTTCIHRQLIRRGADGELGIDRMIRFGEELGIDTINFHDLLKAGVPMDTWTGNFDVSPEDHVRLFSEIHARVARGQYKIKVRLPQVLVSKSDFQSNPEYFGYCPVKLGERVMVHPNGIIRICSNLICTAYGVARWTRNSIKWDNGATNETLDHDMHSMTPCTNRSKNRRYGEYLPVCFSFKPDQHEPIWQDELRWDARKLSQLPLAR